jgi:hypothetical protein
VAKLKGKAKAAFLRRMARGRNKKRGKTRPKRRGRKGGNVAKRRFSKRRIVRSVRRHARRAQSGINKYLPKTETLVSLATSYAYGKVEATADKDPKHMLNSVPALVPQLGRAGNAGAIAWLVGVVTRQPTVKAIASGVLHVAAYQNARGAEFTKDKQTFTMAAGRSSRGRDEQLVEQYLRNQGA